MCVVHKTTVSHQMPALHAFQQQGFTPVPKSQVLLPARVSAPLRALLPLMQTLTQQLVIVEVACSLLPAACTRI